MTDKVKTLAPQIWEAIQKSNNILMHWHPSPDPDTVGSSLGMMHALSAIGKKVTVISGDSEVPEWAKTLPGSEKVLVTNYLDLDKSSYDLFIIGDSSSPEMISNKGDVAFPESMNTVVIDHHFSNKSYAKINLVDWEYIATCQIVVDLLNEWVIEINSDIAACLFLGLYTDSGGFKYAPTNEQTFLAAAQLAKVNNSLNEVVFKFENANSPGRVKFWGLAFSQIENHFSGKVAISTVSFDQLQKNSITKKDTEKADIANDLKSVIGWEIGISLHESEPNRVGVGLRTRDVEKYDLTKLAVALGGGGHKAAAGAVINKPFEEAKKILLETIQKVYPDLGNP